MKLWLLEPVNLWDPWYDKAFGFVVRASTESVARQAAKAMCGAEGPDVWMDPDKTSCYELTADGPPRVILRDFARA